MICDKCGFEHNNRSACPKCGARAIYVNEDYARRRREWEEAQKKGTAGVIPPGIMHSTKEEHDIRTGRDRVTHVKQEGGSEMTGLSFAVIKERFIKWIAKIIIFFQKKKKRGANNPVIRKLEFSKKPDSLDDSKLVLSHKVFKDKRKPIFIGGIIFILLAVGIPVTVHNIKRIDHTRILIFDGMYGYYADNPDNKIFGAPEGAVVTAVDSKSFYETDSTGITLFNSGKNIRIDAINPNVVVTNEKLSAVIYESQGKLIFYKNSALALDCDGEDVSTSGCKVSDNGKYYVITTLKENGDDSIYTMYYGTEAGITKLSSDDYQKVVIDVLDDGKVLYLEMDNAEYGIVNDRAIKIFDGISERKLVDNIIEYKYVDAAHMLYYIDDKDKLFVSENMKQTYIDNDVQAFCENKYDEIGVYYLKDNGCYEVSSGNDYTTPIFKLNQTEITLYFDRSNDYLYYTDATGLYFVNNIKGQGKNNKIADINYGETPVLLEGGTILLIDSNGSLIKYDLLQEKIAENVSDLMLIDNYGGYFYKKNNKSYILNAKHKEIAVVNSENVSKIIYSKKNFYIQDENNNLFQISKNGKKIKNLGAGYNIFIV